jgi:hypothetical protein
MEAILKSVKLERGQDLEIIPVGDIHFGSANCDEKLLSHVIEHIRTNDNAYWVGMGDYGEFISHRDKRFLGKAISKQFLTCDSISEIAYKQYEHLKGLFMPIKDKCLGLLKGNHEHKVLVNDGLNVTHMMANALGAPYLGDLALITLRCEYYSDGIKERSCFFNMYASHGWQAGRDPGGKINTLRKIFISYPNVDIILTGHSHDLVAMPFKANIVSAGRSELVVVPVVRWGVLTGSFLHGAKQGTENYAESFGYAPLPNGVAKVIMSFKTSRVHSDRRTKNIKVEYFDVS